MGEEVAGERVLQEAVRVARSLWDSRLVAAYALGSLAHGGFSPLVSDVDLALILADPLVPDDAQAIASLKDMVTTTGIPLADRLSVFWGSVATLSGTMLSGAAPGGRFPPLDRLDLIRYGRLLAGEDIRAHLAIPSQRELIVAGATFALQSLATPQVTTMLRTPALLVAAGARTLTKRVLFAVRFLYTARTGQVGENETAVEHFTAMEDGPAATLARAACAWRTAPPDPDDPAVVALLADGLLPIYHDFIDEYTEQLRQYDEHELAQAFKEWRRHLG